VSGEGRGGAKGRGPNPSSNAAHLPPLLGSRSYYEARVDADLAAFRGANAGMAATGSFKEGTSKEALLRAVAGNNVMMATIMGGGGGARGGGAVGAMSRWDAAWHDPEAAAVYEWLRDDHEIAVRLQNLELKLSFVQVGGGGGREGGGSRGEAAETGRPPLPPPPPHRTTSSISWRSCRTRNPTRWSGRSSS